MTADFEFEIGVQPPADDSAFEDFWTNFRSEVNSSSSNSTTRTALRTMLSEKYRSGFEAMDLMHSTAEEAVNWASETVHGALDETPEDDAFAEYINLQVGLGGRALLAFDEVGWLLRGGYPQGAWTRVRTIHELFVVAASLGLYGMPDGEYPELVARYVCHHGVFTPSVAKDLSAANPDVASKLDDEVRQALDAKRQALISQYGKEFARPWGWAAPILPNGNPSFSALSKLVLPDFSVFYRIASAHLHASSEGLNDALRHQDLRTKYVYAGPEDGNLAAPAVVASGLLMGVLGAIVPLSVSMSPPTDPITDGRYILGALTRIHQQISDGMSAERNHVEVPPPSDRIVSDEARVR